MYKAPETLILNNSEWYVRAILNGETSENLGTQFLHMIYNQYVSIRRALGGNKCTKMSLLEVKRLAGTLEGQGMLKNSLKLNDEQIETILYVAENYIKMVR